MIRPLLYKEEFCDEVLALGKQGKSVAQMCAAFGISRQTIDNWAARFPEFDEALKVAKIYAQDWWENAGQVGIVDNKFNAQVWKTTMQARFREDYTERHEVSGPNGKPIQTEEVPPEPRDLAKALALILAKGLKTGDA